MPAIPAPGRYGALSTGAPLRSSYLVYPVDIGPTGWQYRQYGTEKYACDQIDMNQFSQYSHEDNSKTHLIGPRMLATDVVHFHTRLYSRSREHAFAWSACKCKPSTYENASFLVHPPSNIAHFGSYRFQARVLFRAILSILAARGANIDRVY